MPQAGRTHSRGPAVGSRAHARTAPPRGPAHAKSARNAQASAGTKDEGCWEPMARVLGQMRASTDPLSGAKGLKERAHFGLSAGKWPRCYRKRKHPRIARRPFQECHGVRCPPRHLKSVRRCRLGQPFLAPPRLSFAAARSWSAFARKANRQAALSGRQPKLLAQIAGARTHRHAPTDRRIARTAGREAETTPDPRRPATWQRQIGCRTIRTPIASSRLEVPCRRSLPNPVLPVRPHRRVPRCCAIEEKRVRRDP
jgi:hypothetical protein